MDKFWERYIQSRPAPGASKGAFDAFAAAHRDPGPRNMYAGGQLVRNTVDGSRPGYAENVKKQKLELGFMEQEAKDIVTIPTKVPNVAMFDLEDEDKQIATGIYQEKTETKPNKNK